jgi:phosphonate transport system permease protein
VVVVLGRRRRGSATSARPPILGFVGAGGIGQQILVSMNLFDYSKVATLVGVTILMVLLVDRFSAAIRRRLVY